MKRWLRVLLPAGFLAGTALILGWTTGGPGVPRIPSWGALKEGLSSTYLPVAAVFRALGILGWALWFYIFASGALRVVAHLATRAGLPGAATLVRLSNAVTPPILRRVFDLVLGGALFLSVVSAPRLETAHPAVRLAPMVESTNGGASVRNDIRLPVHDFSETHPAPTYEVKPADSLWRIAERELGSGFRWREIFDLNVGRHMEDGRRLERAKLIRPGWSLILPGSPEPQAVPSPSAIHVSQPTTSAPAQATVGQEPVEKVEPVPTEKAQPLKVELPDGGAMAASFAAGLLAASALQRLRRRRVLRPDVTPAKARTGPAVQAARRYSLDPSVDVIGPVSEAVIRLLANTAEDPKILAAWEETASTTFLLDGVDVKHVPAHHETATALRIHVEKSEDHLWAVATGPRTQRLRPSPFASADGVLVPVGFTETGVLHIPLLGSPISLSGEGADLLAEAALLAAAARLGPGSIKVISSIALCPSLAADRFAETEWDETLRRLERETLRRRRLLAEKSAINFSNFVLENPDDQLPVNILLVDAATAPGMAERLEAVSFAGISVVMVGAAVAAHRRIQLDGSSCVVQLEDEEPIRVVPLLLPPEVVSEASSLLEDEKDATPPAGLDESIPDQPVGRDEERAFPPPPDRPEMSRILCLGSWRVEVDGEVVERGWRQTERELLALLIANRDGLIRDRIIETLWPGADPTEKEHIFWRNASDLRMKLRGRDGTAGIVLRFDELYRLDWDNVWVDVAAFEEAIRAANKSSDPEMDLRLAIDLYRGDFCADMYYDWAEEFRTHLRNVFVKAVLALAETLQSQDRIHEALETIDLAIKVEKYAELLYARAMQLEAKLKRRDAVVLRFRRLQGALEDLDLEPAAETVELFNSLAQPLTLPTRTPAPDGR